MLTLYRRALRLRRGEPGLTGEAMAWVDMGEEVLAFDREGVRCVVNFGAEPVESPEGAEVLLASGEVVDGRLPRDTAVWLRLP